MKKNARPPYVIVFTAIAAVFMLVSLWSAFSSGAGGASPAYSSFNVKKDGAGLLYDALSKMGHSVSRSYEPISAYGAVNSAHVIIAPDYYLVNRRQILEWVYRGGRLVWLDEPRRLREIIAAEGLILEDYFDNLFIMRYGDGNLVLGSPDAFANGYLMQNRNAGRALESVLKNWNADSILFNEYYHGYSSEPNFFRELPLLLRLLIIQAMIAAAVTVWRLGKRFGRPVIYHEEPERNGSEFIIALADVFERSKKAENEFKKYLTGGGS